MLLKTLLAPLSIVCTFKHYMHLKTLNATLNMICIFKYHMNLYTLYASLNIVCTFNITSISYNTVEDTGGHQSTAVICSHMQKILVCFFKSLSVFS